jgi:hypothetical protein
MSEAFLVRVQRSEVSDFYLDGRQRHTCEVVLTSELKLNNYNPDTQTQDIKRMGEFFYFHATDLQGAIEALAKANPGCEVEVFQMTQVVVCPAGPMVTKAVTKDGELPA